AFSVLRAQLGSLARSLFGSLLASTATGAKCVAGPSGFGDSTAFDRSMPRNSSGRYSSASAMPPAANSAVTARTGTNRFRTIFSLLNTRTALPPSSCISRNVAVQFQRRLPSRLLWAVVAACCTSEEIRHQAEIAAEHADAGL